MIGFLKVALAFVGDWLSAVVKVPRIVLLLCVAGGVGLAALLWLGGADHLRKDAIRYEALSASIRAADSLRAVVRDSLTSLEAAYVSMEQRADDADSLLHVLRLRNHQPIRVNENLSDSELARELRDALDRYRADN